MAAESFFRRWAMRKAASRESEALRVKRDSPAVDDASPAIEPPRRPTLEDVARLNADADYSLFMADGTDPVVRRAALKALFSDPRFQAMDGLDVYIGDYTRHAPLTPAMLAALQHARSVTATTQCECGQVPEQAKLPADPPPSASADEAQDDEAQDDEAGLEQAGEQRHSNHSCGDEPRAGDQIENPGMEPASTVRNSSLNRRSKGQMR